MNDIRLGYPPAVVNSVITDYDSWLDEKPYPLGIPKRVQKEAQLKLNREAAKLMKWRSSRTPSFHTKNVTHSDYVGMRAMGFSPSEQEDRIPVSVTLEKLRMTPEEYFSKMRDKKIEEQIQRQYRYMQELAKEISVIPAIYREATPQPSRAYEEHLGAQNSASCVPRE